MSLFSIIRKRNKTSKPMDPGTGFSGEQTIPLQQEKEEQETMSDNTNLHVPQNTAPTPAAQVSPEVMKMITAKPRMKTFDIFVIDEGADGKPTREQLSGVKASSAQELINLYNMCGQKIQIIREYPSPEEVEEKKRREAERKEQPQMKVMDFNEKSMQNKILNPEPIDENLRKAYKDMMNVPVTPKKEPPRFFEIGGVKCKLEDGKMYQEQWVKVDATKYRLVADTTNKLVSLDGKHLETLKWVQIEGEEQENA